MPDPSELIFPDEPDFSPNEPVTFQTPQPESPRPMPPRPPMRPQTPPLCSVSGTVKNWFGFPISGARIALYTSASGSFRPIDEVRSNRFGFYRFSRVRPGRYTLVATAAFRSERKDVSVSPRRCRQEGIDFRL